MRLALPVAVLAIAALVLAGCGGSGGSGPDPATLAPPGAPVFIDATVQPEGKLKSNLDSLAKNVAGIDSVGGLILSELEKSALSSGEEFDYEKEVEPWIGDRAGLFLESYDGKDFHGYGIALQTTDSGASEEFVEKQVESSDEAAKDGSYEGVDFKVEADGTTIGVIGEFLAVAENERSFKRMVDAENGESLADQDSYSSTVSDAPAGGVADVFVDVGRLIEESGGSIDAEAKQFLDSAGIDPTKATAVATLIPGSEQLEIDVSSDLAEGEQPLPGDASKILASLPAGPVAAVAVVEFGKRLQEGVDSVDEAGIPGKLEPHELKRALKESNIDLESILGSLGDAGVFVEGDTESSLGGAAVIEAKSPQEAANTVSNIGLLLRASNTPGVTALSGRVSGFSVRDPELGNKPIVVAAKGGRIAVAYGLPAAVQALDSNGRLGDSPAYKEAVAALGETPIVGFVDGPAALHLASALVGPGDEGFLKAKPYLTKIDYIAIGTAASGDLGTVRLIAGVGK